MPALPDESLTLSPLATGLRNLADWEAGLREMKRVRRAGRTPAGAGFGKPDNALLCASVISLT